ncbi:MAG: iron-containing alcohol dehydrogenase [Chloroflexi bacterium]|nr:MAG: iron-containing alcohol dehydrogenase [Chloroflexota bacterium]
MDVVLIGLPGSGKSVVGRRLAHRHGAAFIDLDASIEAAAGRSIEAIFEAEGEAGFRSREAAAVVALGDPDPDPGVRRVIATGGGTILDSRNRWRLFRGRLPVWLDARPEALAQRLRRSRHVRPLIVGREPVSAIRQLGAARQRYYAAAHRVNGLAEPSAVAATIARLVDAGIAGSTRLLDAETRIGRIVVGDGIAADEVVGALGRLGAGRAILVSEPGAWAAVGAPLAEAVRTRGLSVDVVTLPSGEDAKRLAAIEVAASDLARLRVERGEPLVAVGGGALGDAAGFLAAIWMRGVPVVHVPTTLVAQIDSSIGGKTAVDLPEGKNLVGAFHQPESVIVDVRLLETLPERQRRAALGEAVKMAALGDERLFHLLETEGAAIARGDPAAHESGAVAELVERALWAKVEIVLADERERGSDGGRVTLNLGHSAGHAFEALGGFGSLLHGEAVAYGLRVACRVGRTIGLTPPERAARIEDLLTALGLVVGALPFTAAETVQAMATDKKRTAGRLRWVIPTADGVVVRSDVPDEVVVEAIAGLLATPNASPATPVR